MLHSSGFIAKVFDVFRHHEVVIDLISTSEVNISCTVNDSERMDELIKDLEELGTVTVHGERAILSLCLLYTSPSPRDVEGSRMPSSA